MKKDDIKRLALILSVQAEIDGMKASNSQHPENQPFTKEQFDEKASKLITLAYIQDEKL